jgi:hypothetical protein
MLVIYDRMFIVQATEGQENKILKNLIIYYQVK